MIIIRFFTIISAIMLIIHEHRKIDKSPQSREKFGKYLRIKLEQLGPTFIKIGQILSLRPDLVPIEYCMALRGLLDKTKDIPLEMVLQILENELGYHPKKVFSHISEKSIGSASLAQVHKGRIRDTNTFVAIKVRKPGVEKLIKADILILKTLNYIFKPLIQKRINSDSIIRDLDNVLDKELNFAKEGMNIERFAENFKNLHYIKTPKVYWDYTNDKVLVMEFISGIQLNKVFHKMDHEPNLHKESSFDIDGIHIDKKALAKKLIHVTAQSVFLDGFFHADPHPANIILTYDDKIAFIDFGMVGDLLSNEKVLFREVVFCISTKDEEKILQLLLVYNKEHHLPYPDESTMLRVQHFMHDLISEFSSSDQSKFPITKFMYSLGGLAFKFHFPPPSFLMLISKQIFTLEGIASYLIPNLNIVEEFKPFVYSYKTKEALKKISNEKLMKFVDDSLNLGMNFPESLQAVLQTAGNKTMMPIEAVHKPPAKNAFIVFCSYLFVMGIFITKLLNASSLLFVMWSSIIALVLILYFILYRHTNG